MIQNTNNNNSSHVKTIVIRIESGEMIRVEWTRTSVECPMPVLVVELAEERAAAHDPVVRRAVGGQQHGDHEVGRVARRREHAAARARLVHRRRVHRAFCE